MLYGRLRNHLFLIYFFTLFLSCQETAALIYKRVSEEVNIPITNQISDIVETKNGYIWFATDVGLSGYNGNQRFQYSNIYPEKNLNFDTVYSMATTSNDVIWLGTHYGLSSFDYRTRKFTNYKNTNKTLEARFAIKKILVFKDKFLIINTFNRKLYFFDIQNNRYISSVFKNINKEILTSDKITIELYDDGFLLLKNGKELSQIKIVLNTENKAQVYQKNINIKNNITNKITFIKSTQDHLLLTTTTHLVELNKKTFNLIKSTKFPSNRTNDPNKIIVTDILELEKEFYMIATHDSGIFTLQDGTFSQDISLHLDLTTITSNRIFKLLKDSHDTVWIVGKGNKVDKMDYLNQAIKIISPILKLNLASLKPFSVNAILYQDQKLWLGTDEGIITNNNYNDSVGFVEFEKEKSNNISVISRIKNLNNSYFALAPNQGIWTLDTKGKIKQKVQIGNLSRDKTDSIRNIVQDKNKNLWIETYHGLYKHEYNKESKQNYNFIFNKVAQINSNGYLDIHVSKNNSLILSTYVHGVFEYNEKEKTVRVLFDWKPYFNVIHVTEYHEGVLFLATDKGFFSYNLATKKIDKHNLYQNRLSKANIYNIFPINKHEVILSLSNGLAIYNITTNKHQFIDVSHLLKDADFNYKAATRHKNKLYIGGVLGIVVIDLNKLVINYSSKIPQIVVDNIEILDAYNSTKYSYLNHTNTLEFNAQGNSFKINYSILNSPFKKVLSYKYKLSPLEKEWVHVESPEEPLISYSNIPSGVYDFQIMTSINNTQWGEPSHLGIKILTPLWRVWWMVSIYIFLFSSIIYSLLRNKFKLIKAKIEENKQLHLSKKIFNNSSDGICIADKKLHVKQTNASFLRITGFTEKELKNKTFFTFTDKFKSKNIKKKIINTLHMKGFWKGELKLETKLNGTIIIEVKINKLVNSSKESDLEYLIVFSNISERKSHEKELEKLSLYDGLTGLANRNLFIKMLEKYKTSSKNNNKKFAIIFMDLNDFKKVNDYYGHRFGDQLLQVLGARFLRTIGKKVPISRFGGDEFCLLLVETDISIYKMIKKLNYKFQNIFTKPFIIEEKEIIISPAIGVSIYPLHSENTEELMKFADIAMYQAKKSKIINCNIYNQDKHKQPYPRVKLEVDLKNAIKNKLVRPFIQPQVIVETQEVIGYEILARWITNENKFIDPDIFIPMAEKSNTINEIFLQLYVETIQAFEKEFVNNKFNPPKLSFNLCPNQLYNRSLLNKLHKKSTKYNIPTSSIVLEITETALISKPGQAKQAMLDLKKLGYKIALDDFGTGHSSLTHLKDFPVDYIKIDKSFISNMGVNTKVYSIVESVIHLAKKLHITIIAEGVENLEQVELLKNLKCEIIQGYYYGKPSPISHYYPHINNYNKIRNHEINVSNMVELQNPKI